MGFVVFLFLAWLCCGWADVDSNTQLYAARGLITRVIPEYSDVVKLEMLNATDALDVW